MVANEINAQRDKEKRGLLLTALPIFHILFIGFIWFFQLGMMSPNAFSLPPIKNLYDLFILILSLTAFILPIFSSVAILLLRRVGIYTLVLIFFTDIYIVFSSSGISSSDLFSFAEYYGGFLAFWLLYFFAIKRKWYLFT